MDHSIKELFLDHLNTKLVCYSDPHCNGLLLVQYSNGGLNTRLNFVQYSPIFKWPSNTGLLDNQKISGTVEILKIPPLVQKLLSFEVEPSFAQPFIPDWSGIQIPTAVHSKQEQRRNIIFKKYILSESCV